MFVNRKKEFHMLKTVIDSVENNENNNIAIIGNRRMGKTELLLEFKRTHDKKNIVMPYLNVQRVGNLQSFIMSYYRELLFEIGKKRKLVANKTDFSNWDDILILSAKIGIDDISEKLKTKNDTQALDFLFESQETILKKTDYSAVFLLDEFQYVKNFGNRFTEIMRSIVEKQQRTAYIVTGSSISMMEEIFSKSSEPFFAQFRRMYLGFLNKQNSKKLAELFLNKHNVHIDNQPNNEIFRLTNGHPFYIISLCRGLIEEFDDSSIDTIKHVFLKETLSPKGDIYLVLDYIFNQSLSRAYKGKIHRQILLILAKKQGLTLTEISKELDKPSGEVSNYMKKLLTTDLIIREENNYFFRDPLLAFWIKYTYLGINDIELEEKKVVDRLIEELTEKYLQASSELGRTKEYEFKVKLEEKYDIKFSNYVSSDRKREFDLVSKKHDVYYIAEVKWRNRKVSIKDILDYSKKIQNSIFSDKKKKILFISKSGFDKKAIQEAKKEEIHCLDKNLNKIV
ncbi:MAG TPA: ATP-binding protein [Candidatus Thermoplasmatota archaeon]|nr:ATP-binding protein [Candidatus Thermoplasmatota archaeon]